MDHRQARRMANRLNYAGFRVVADSRGGWAGGPASEVWGVRPFQPDGLVGNYEERDQLPPAWLRAVQAAEAMEAAAAMELEHRKSCPQPGCALCVELKNAMTRAYHAWEEARAK